MTYIYTYAGYEEERDLCALEMRSFFGKDSETGILESSIKIDPSRSPFIKERLAILAEGDMLDSLLEKVAELPHIQETFKVLFIKKGNEDVEFKNRRAIERKVGSHVNGIANLHNPMRLFAIMNVNGRWVFADYVKSESVWFHHQQKPHHYSTALNTRTARAVVNIAVPEPTGVKVIDPCCGIGTVLVEALSMGIEIVGSDRNPLVLGGTRENIAHFGYTCEVKRTDIRDVSGFYDVAIIDLPYNLCSVITSEEQLEMLQSARRFAGRVVVVTVEPIDDLLTHVGFTIVDRAVVKKGSFSREVIVCE